MTKHTPITTELQAQVMTKALARRPLTMRFTQGMADAARQMDIARTEKRNRQRRRQRQRDRDA